MKEKDLKEYFLAISPSDAQKERIRTEVQEYFDAHQDCAEMGDNMKFTPIKKKIGRVGLIAAVMVLATVSAFAATPQLRSWLGEQFSLTPSMEADFEASGSLQNIQSTASSDNLNLTVHQTLSDSDNMYLVYEVATGDGSVLPDDVKEQILAQEMEFNMDEPDDDSVFLCSVDQKILQECEDGITGMLIFSGISDLEGQKVSLALNDLTAHWTMGTPSEMEMHPADLTGTDAWTNTDYHVEGYSISPLCIKLDLSCNGSLNDNAGVPDQITVELETAGDADSSIVRIVADSYTVREANGTRTQFFLLDEIINPEQVKAVYVDGEKL